MRPSSLRGSRVGEHDINKTMAAILDDLNPFWKVKGQPLGTMKGKWKPDIVIESETAAPIIIETEIMPASTVEKDGIDRLGLVHYETNIKISTVMVVRVPVRLTQLDGDDLYHELSTMSDIDYAVYSPERYPTSGWLKGTMRDIAMSLQISTVPSSDVDECVDMLEASMNAVGNSLTKTGLNTKITISELLNQPPSPQTWKMAGLILSNAMMFHDIVSENNTTANESIRPLASLRLMGKISQKKLMDEWNRILQINYAPIFEVALDIMANLTGHVAGEIIEELDKTTSLIQARRMTTSGDMYGVLFQRVIADKTKLATYYTRPNSAALIATLVTPSPDSDYYRPENLRHYTIADFACGTGLLLSSVYRMLVMNYEMNRNNDSNKKPFGEYHRTMMENNVVGLDVIPIGTHLTVSALALIFPDQKFDDTKIKTMPIGIHHGQPRLGSLDLIDDERIAKIVPDIKTVSGKQNQSTKNKNWSISDAHHQVADYACNLIVMNPPFVRPVNHAGTHADDVVPAWAAFGATETDQIVMGKHATKKFKNTCGAGNAGLPSHFIAVCEKKLSRDGMMALIVPATISNGSAWEKCRKIINAGYELTVISIANHTLNQRDMSFSSDTGMAEIILLAHRHNTAKKNKRHKFVSLHSRPNSPLEAFQVGNLIKETPYVDALETAHGGTTLMIGNQVVGTMLDCPTSSIWGYVNVLDPFLEQKARALVNNKKTKFTTLETLFDVGPHTLDITGETISRIKNASGDYTKKTIVRGPFHKYKISLNSKYSALWNNIQYEQLQMRVNPDVRLEKKKNASDYHVKQVWEKATHAHININPRFNANSLIASYTTKKSLGGASWPNLLLRKNFCGQEFEKAFVAWSNTSVGILCFWSIVGKQQLGRGRTSRTAVGILPIPNFSALSKTKLTQMSKIFDQYAIKKLDRIKNLWKDKTRIGLDDAVMNVLEIEIDIDDVRRRLCLEPSISGGRPDPTLLDDNGLSPFDRSDS